MTDIGVNDQLDSELEDGASGTLPKSEEKSGYPTTFKSEVSHTRSQQKVRKDFTDPGKMTELGSRRGARYLSESSNEQQSPTLQGTLSQKKRNNRKMMELAVV